MKSVLSNVVSFLLFLLVVLCLQVPYTSTQPLHMQLGAVALGLVFLATFINTLRLERPLAGKFVTGLHVVAGVLLIAVVVLAFQ